MRTSHISGFSTYHICLSKGRHLPPIKEGHRYCLVISMLSRGSCLYGPPRTQGLTNSGDMKYKYKSTNSNFKSWNSPTINRDISKVQCYNCGGQGHTNPNCYRANKSKDYEYKHDRKYLLIIGAQSAATVTILLDK